MHRLAKLKLINSYGEQKNISKYSLTKGLQCPQYIPGKKGK
jgi:hypothetical protein